MKPINHAPLANFTRWVVFAVATLVILTIAFFIWKSANEYRLIIRGAEQQTRGYASAMKEHAERAFSEADTAILDVMEHIEERGCIDNQSKESLHKVIDLHRRNHPQIASIFLLNRTGQILAHSGAAPISQIDVTDRDYFMHYRNNPTDNSPFLSKPIKLHVNDKWRIILSRPIRGGRGEFVGLVAVALAPEYFHSFYTTLDLGNNGKTILVRRDGTFLLSVPFNESDYATDFKKSHLIRTYLPLSPQGTFHIARGKALLEPSARIISYDSQDKFPIVAVANIDKDQVLAHWKKNSYLEAALVAAVSAALSLLALGLLRYIRRVDDAHQLQLDQQCEIAASAKDWQATFGAMEDAIWVMDRDRNIRRANKATEQIFETQLDKVVGRKCCEVAHNQDFPVAGCPFQTMLDTGHRASMQFLLGERWYKISVDPVKDDDGIITGAVHIVADIDSIKRVEEALSIRTQEYRTLVENIPDLIVRYDSDLRRIYVNPAWERASGLSAQEVINVPGADILRDSNLPANLEYMAKLRKVLETGTLQRTEFTWVNARGETLYLDYVLVPEYGRHGDITSVLAAGHDITERKRSEELLLKSEREFRRLAENMPDNIIRYDCAGRTLYANPIHEKTLGMSAEYMIGKSPMELHPDGQFADFIVMLKKVIETGIDTEFDLVFPDGSGKLLCHQIRFVPERDLEGTMTSILAIGRDITERKRAEEELLKLSAAIEQSPVTIIIADAQGNIEFVNPKFTELTGYLSAEVLGKNARILKSGMTPPEEYKALWDTITSGKVWHGELYNKKRSGEYFREKATIAPVRNREGVITDYIAIKEDITEKRKLEEQLRQAQKMEAIGQLAGGVAHDFNNLLQVITTYGFLIQKHFKKHNQPLAFIDEQMVAIRRAVDLTSALLTFSRKQTLNPKPVDLNRILNESQKLLERVIGEDIVFEMTPASCEMIVRADASSMHQVLMNLATNARDAMPKGGRLTISIEKKWPDVEFMVRNGCNGSEEFALMTVTDTGEGIAPEDLQRIFEPFFTTKETGKGTGLGLAIIYGIIRQHNGFMEVDSLKGKGASFRIYLPLLIAHADTDQSETMEEDSPGSETILLVEDELLVRQSLQAVISNCGYSVLEVADGEEAVRIFRENAGRVDLVIMDMIMPKKNGWEALQEIRTINPEIRSIFLSGYTSDILESKGIEEGTELLIMKPVNPHLLLDAIRRLLNKTLTLKSPDKIDQGDVDQKE